MKSKLSKIAAIIIFLIANAIILNAQSNTIEEIQKTPTKYNNEVVKVKGLVKQHIEGNKTSTDMYVLVGDAGGFIRVLTSKGLPETYKKYSVTGILLKDADKGGYFISEQSRVLAEPVQIVETSQITEQLPEPVTKPFPLKIIIIIAIAILIIVLVYFLIKARKNEMNNVDYTDNETAAGAEDSTSEFVADTDDEDFKTIRVLTGAPKTMVFIPGELKIISGEDTGKSFKIAAYPTPAGNIVTIGREKITGEREYAHIQLKEKTVSRKQAEIIQKDGKLSVKNLSETNYSQVDGVELKPGEKADLHKNSTIRTGEVEFQYID